MGSEIACVYAALILHDEGLEISAENISKILKASNVTVEAYWPTLFAKLCKGKDMGAMLTTALPTLMAFGALALYSSGLPSTRSFTPAEPVRMPICTEPTVRLLCVTLGPTVSMPAFTTLPRKNPTMMTTAMMTTTKPMPVPIRIFFFIMWRKLPVLSGIGKKISAPLNP
jgi:large subunit ribosomal protein LP1